MTAVTLSAEAILQALIMINSSIRLSFTSPQPLWLRLKSLWEVYEMVKSHLHNVDVLPSHAFANLNVGLAIRKLLGDHIGVVDPQPGWVGTCYRQA